MKLKSELVSNVLRILLWALLLLSILDFAGTILYTTYEDYYYENIYTPNHFILVVSNTLNWIILLVYLIWIYVVHKDLHDFFARFPRTPILSLMCMIIPIYNLYGIPAVYLQIGEFYRTQATGLSKQGHQIRLLAVPLLVGVFLLLNFEGIFTDSVGYMSDSLFITLGVIELITFCIFIYMRGLVSQGLNQLQAQMLMKSQMEKQLVDHALDLNRPAFNSDLV